MRRRGSLVVVRFNTANTATSPTLNVNGTGAAPIWLNGAALNTAALARQIAAGTTYGFMFNGTQWEMLILGGNLPTLGIGYDTVTTAAATAAKVGTLANFVRRTGSVVWLLVSTANTALNPTLNVNASGAAPIWVDGAALNTADRAALLTAGLHSFVFDGTNWRLKIDAATMAEARLLDAAYCTSEADMQSKNLRTGAFVLMAVVQ